VLNVRLYRTCWLVAGVALVVALLTLQTPSPGPEPALPSTIDGQGTARLAAQLAAIAPVRAPGSGPDQAAGRWVHDQLAQVPGSKGRVQTQDLEARAGGETLRLQNVYLSIPGTGQGAARQSGIVVVAPRDTPVGVAAGTSSTAVLLRLAQVSATTRHARPQLFVSTDGSTVGNAGLRWFLERFRDFPVAAVVSLDAPGEANGDRVHIWVQGRADRQALALGHLAERSVERAGGRPSLPESLAGQLMRLAVPQTFGEQGPAIAHGIPAVTLSARSESPLRPGRDGGADRMEMVANAANGLLGVLDAEPAVPAADRSLAFAGKTLRPTMTRLAFLLVMLPVLVLTLDVVARERRGRVPMGDGLRVVGLRAVPPLAALAVAHLLTLGGLLPRAAAGEPPIPAQTRFGAGAGLGVAIVIAVAVIAVVWSRRRTRRIGAPPGAEGAAALSLLCLLMIVLWFVNPFALILALPAAHAVLLAVAARRPWHLAALAAIAVAPFLVLLGVQSGVLNANPFFTTWYLLETAASGSRGAVGLLIAILIGACVWSLAALVGGRAAKRGLAPVLRRLGPRPRAAGRPRRRPIA
jgi:hypothetical protein